MMYLLSKDWNTIGMDARDVSNSIAVFDYQFQKKSTKQRPPRYLKGAGTLENGFAGENKATSEMKIRSFTIETGAAVSIVRKGLARAEDVEPIPETIRMTTVTGSWAKHRWISVLVS
ncbi:hypothetical protein Zmor_026101 [Zophobas morio]|uniref:Uncharacterized protein n=1 Tax=Zophobas morio TaxID=2755281 RepID=A0AA38M5Q5_9CUCU|nr:hypothetical protein Zmor_026101 [Zophobas morio]